MKFTAPVVKVPPGATVPVLTVRVPMVPPAPVMVPLVAEVALATLPVTFKVPLNTSMVSPIVVVEESPERVSEPTPYKDSLPVVPPIVIGVAKVLAALVEFRINWVPSLMVKVPVLVVAPIFKAPPETMVPPRVTKLVALPVMVAPVVNEVVFPEPEAPKLTPPVFKNTGAPERTVVPTKVTA